MLSQREIKVIHRMLKDAFINDEEKHFNKVWGMILNNGHIHSYEQVEKLYYQFSDELVN